LALFDHTHHDKIIGNDFVELGNKKEQLRNALIEKTLSVKEIAFSDIKTADFSIHDVLLNDEEPRFEMNKDPHYLKYYFITEICEKLGVKNTLDRDTIIDETIIIDNLDFFKSRFYSYLAVFDLSIKISLTKKRC